MTSPDTIFAFASGFGRTAIAIMRLSGPACRDVLAGLTAGHVPTPRRAGLRRLVDPENGEMIDQALVMWLPGPHSFTGEDQAELHVHGGPAIRRALTRLLGGWPGLRDAEPGEFTRRAFLAGRMDLGAVEGLADLIEAETEAQRRQALRQLDGALGRRVESWRARLIEAAALLEAGLDFSDEGDVPSELLDEVRSVIGAVSGEIKRELAGTAAERLRDGFTVVIAGPPNAGKSTLLNALARREVAIVSPYPGTTRDPIEVRCDLAGLPVSFIDTAGLRETVDPIEHEGIRRARERAANADLVLWLRPANAPDEPSPFGDETLVVQTKADLGVRHRGGIAVSARSGEGLDELIAAVRTRADARFAGAGDAVVTRERHRRALGDVIEALHRALVPLEACQEELAAEDLRLALRALGRITGRVDVEDVLDRVFGQFCIGK